MYTQNYLPHPLLLPPPTTADLGRRREQKMTNINSGTAVLKEITSQNHWQVASTNTFICFAQSLTHGKMVGREGRVQAV